MKYNNDTNINVVSIGEKLEDYLLENKGRYLEDSDEGNTIELQNTSSLDEYRLGFDRDGTAVYLPKSLFNTREQSYIEGVTTRQPIVYMLGCKEVEGEQ